MKTKFFLPVSVLIVLLCSSLKAQDVEFSWAKQISAGTSWQEFYINNKIAVDQSGNVYETGYFYGTVDFDPGSGVLNLTSSGDKDFFVLKLDPNGNLIWAYSFGGTGVDQSYDITVDAEGFIYITGSFDETVDFDPGPGSYDLTAIGRDIFILKLDNSGNLIWVKQMGGTSWQYGIGICVDNSGNIYTTGEFGGSVDFDPNSGVYILSPVYNAQHIFIVKLDESGNFVWAEQFGSACSSSSDIAINAAGDIYLTGNFYDTTDFDPGSGTFSLISFGDYDIFVSKISASGNLIWAKQMGGIYEDLCYSIAVDSEGSVYTTGDFSSTADFDPGSGVYSLTSLGGNEVFISKLNTSGNFVWAKRIGGIWADIGCSISIDNSENVLTTGYFWNTVDFDPGTGTYNMTANYGDIFISKLSSNGDFILAKQMGGQGEDQGFSITSDVDGNILTSGHFEETADFDPGTGSYNMTSVGSSDLFIVKLGTATNPQSIIDLSGNLSFGEIQVGNSSQLTFTITNTGTAELLVSSISYPSPVFTGNWSGTIAPGANHVVTVTFSPTEAITYSGNVIVNSNAGSGTNTLPISGTGTPAPYSLVTISTYISNPCFPGAKTLWNGNTTQSPSTIKICADASDATRIKFVNNTGITSDKIKFWIESDPYGNNSDLTGYFINYEINGNIITAKYAHPKYLPADNGLYRTDNIRIVDYTNPSSTIFTVPIRIYRAPVLFVHGLLGYASTFDDMISYLKNNSLYNSTLLHAIDYHATSPEAFASNVDEIPNGIDDLLFQVRNINYSAGKVDIVSHSMGGIISRLYLQGNYGFYYRGDVNKLITLNTPHSGSQFANWASVAAVPFCGASLLLFENSWFCNGACVDLQTYSYAIDNQLNAQVYLNKGHVPSHTVSSYIQDEDIRECLEPMTYGLLPIYPFMVPLIFGEGELMDGVVRVDSQKGGLTGNHTSNMVEQCHLGATHDISIIEDVMQLLSADPNGGHFTFNGFDPEDMKSNRNIYPSQPNSITQNRHPSSDINITSPPDGSSYLSGQGIPITVQSDASVKRLVFLFGNDDKILSYIDTTISTNTTTINYFIPPVVIGPLIIEVIGLDSTSVLATDNITLNISNQASLDSLQFSYDYLMLLTDHTKDFHVTGFYSDGISRNITNLSGVQYSVVDPGVAMISSPGIIEGISSDTTALIVQYQGFNDTIPVYVFQDSTRSLPLFSSNINVICNQSGEVTFYDISSGNPQSIEWHFQGGSPSVSNDSIAYVYYHSPGIYDVYLIATYTNKTDTLYLPGFITVSQPPVSTISLINDTLYCSISDGASYLWYLNDNPIANSNLSYYHPDSTGNYSVDVMNDDDCIARSETFYYTNTGTTHVNGEVTVSIYPNPTDGSFTIDIGKQPFGYVTIRDLLGNMIYQCHLDSPKTRIDLSSSHPGLYVLFLNINDQITVNKLIKR